jgi:hypothetical protein
MRIAVVLVLFAALVPAPASAQVDDWRVLHVGLQSGASVDTDGNGKVNSWYDCKQQGNSKKAHCRFSALYDKWQADMSCFESTVEGWSNDHINIVNEQVFLETQAVLTPNPYDFAWNGWADQYNFAAYDVVIVWTAFTQATGADGAAWGADAGHGNYGFISLYGVYGDCASWGGGLVPHVVTWLYRMNGWPVCNTYDYPTDGHAAIWQNWHTPVTCSFGPSAGMTSTGIPAEALASGSIRDYY